jgi:hypothetical protein
MASESDGAMRGILTALPGLLLLAAPVVSAEAEPAKTRAAFDSARDLEIQVRARQLLLADEELAPFNLGVSVQNGVAVVWGPVPSPELKAKALKTIENVRGVFKVESEMYVSHTAGTFVNPGGPRLLPDAPQQSSSAMPDWQTGQLPAFTGQFALKKTSEPAPPPKLVMLMPPVAAPNENASSDPTSAIETIRRGDVQYRLIQYEMKDGAIYLHGTAKPENVMAFARAISNVPGVERVVLRNSSNH